MSLEEICPRFRDFLLEHHDLSATCIECGNKVCFHVNKSKNGHCKKKTDGIKCQCKCREQDLKAVLLVMVYFVAAVVTLPVIIVITRRPNHLIQIMNLLLLRDEICFQPRSICQLKVISLAQCCQFLQLFLK